MTTSDATNDATTLLRQLVLDCQHDLATYIVPDSGISEHDVVNTLLGRLDGPQAREALAAQAETEAVEEERYTIPTTELFGSSPSAIEHNATPQSRAVTEPCTAPSSAASAGVAPDDIQESS